MKLNDRLRELRQKCGLTQEQVAEKLGVTRQTISSYESGRTEPGLDILRKLAKIYDTEISELVDEASLAEDTVNTDSEQLKSAWICKMIRRASKLSLIVFLGSVFIMSAVQWGMNTFVPMGPDSIVARTQLRCIVHYSVIIGSLVLQYCSAFLIILELGYKDGKSPFKKLKWLWFLTAGTFLITMPFGLTDNVYTYPDYILEPLTSLIVCYIIMAAGQVIISIVRLRRNRCRQE